MKKHLLLTAISVMAVATAAQANYVLGSFQGSTDPSNAGWVDPNNGYQPITNTSGFTSFASGVVGSYPQSLAYNVYGNAGVFGYPSITYNFSSTALAAFSANSYLTFTFSADANGSTTGAFQIYNLAFSSNVGTAAGGWGYANLCSGGNGSWATHVTSETGSIGSISHSGNNSAEPNFYFYTGVSPVSTMAVTVYYGGDTAAILAGGATSLSLTLQGNIFVGGSGNHATTAYFNNVYLSNVPEPTSMALAGMGIALTGMLIRRRRV